jgi:predicted ATP-dependent endonuclease of OLD family
MTKISFRKRANGELLLRWLSGVPRRDVTLRQKAVSDLRRAAASPFFKVKFVGELLPIRGEIERLAELVEALDENPESEALEQLSESTELLAQAVNESAPQYIRSLPELLLQVISDSQKPDPRQETVNRLFARRPEFVRFDDGARLLPSRYDLTTLAQGVPPGLANLASLARLDLEQLASAVLTERRGDVQQMQEAANAHLSGVFAQRWRQAQLSVSLNVEGTILDIYIREATGSFWEFEQRSDGLRWFVALLALLSTTTRKVRPVLLVDEAEQHLHYDAQADLVTTFQSQSTVAGIIYTTHSAGCLPQDLGAGVKVVRRVSPQTSTIRNGFWVDDSGTPDEAGFSAVLMEMGATTFAFSAARYAVVCEGRTELVLLPTLLREVLGAPVLPVQIVPGLASISPYAVPSLDLAAAKVVFLTDSDTAGRRIRAKLLRAGVSGDRVFFLDRDKPSTIEDFIDPVAHRLAIELVFKTSGLGDPPPASRFRDRGRASRLDAWCRAQTPPKPKLDKVSVAHALIAMSREGRPIADPRRADRLRSTADQLLASLGLEL